MNIIKKIQKKQKRKKLMRQKARLAQEQAAQEGAHYGRTSHRRRLYRWEHPEESRTIAVSSQTLEKNW